MNNYHAGLSVYGCGYVGLVTAVCFAHFGHTVCCVDTDEKKISKLNSGISPIHEKDLDVLLKRNLADGRLFFTTDVASAVNHGFYHFITVGTPQSHDGSADLSAVFNVVHDVAKHVTKPIALIMKSTVPVGTMDKISSLIDSIILSRNLNIQLHYVSNPEFLRQGCAIDDFIHSDRIVIGTNTQIAKDAMRNLYKPMCYTADRIINMDTKSAEFTKYAANVILASRISMMSEFSRIADALGVDIMAVRNGIGSDPRITYNFLNPGCGYGGSCFPKDVMAMEMLSRENGCDVYMIPAIHKVNQIQKLVLSQKILKYFNNDIAEKNIALWGLSFKPNTDDMREAPSIVLINELIKNGATINAYDPAAIDVARSLFDNIKEINFFDNPIDCVKDVDALAVVTEWPIFMNPDFRAMYKLMKNKVIFDGRNMYDGSLLRELGFDYYCI